MADQLTFDEAQAKAIETLYLSESVMKRRRRAVELLKLGQGDVFLDLGCGPGFLAVEATSVTGSAGAVHAVDSSDSMLAMARHRAERESDEDQVEFQQGDALQIPYPVEIFDAMQCCRSTST